MKMLTNIKCNVNLLKRTPKGYRALLLFLCAMEILRSSFIVMYLYVIVPY